MPPPITRRDILRTMGSGFGLLSMAGTAAHGGSSLDPKPTHFPARAKHVIYLFLNGGPSQVDTFDPKPMLTRYHGKAAPSGNLKTERKTGNLLKSPFEFKRGGQSGLEISEIFPGLVRHSDDLCVIRSMYTALPNHEPSLFMLNCGHILPGHPSMGSWLTYGLGTLNRNLPGFVVLCPGLPVIGPQLWTSSYLPGVYQGVHIRNQETDPEKLIPNLRNTGLSDADQRAQLDLVAQLNRRQLDRTGPDPQLEAGIASMEIAYRMQTEAMDAFDIRREPQAVRDRYGDSDFQRGCLMARRLVERGVRMVQVYYGNGQPWDNHDDIMIHRKLGNEVDKSITALLDDLKATGLFNETIVIIGGEFGRTPSVEVSGLVNVQNGRDHNNHGFSVAVAGGGFKGGLAYGATDDFGFKAVENRVHPHDLHATVLHQLGLDHTRLTYRYSGRDFRLTDVEGNVVKPLLS
ncbi:MAG: DUF1501 domain-containing protein [Acidobacteria bacterium]|nr:DUF1501 domain-containing protein [Acidobacteriota bacterium]